MTSGTIPPFEVLLVPNFFADEGSTITVEVKP